MKREAKFPQWEGFELSPEGCLLEQVIDLNGEIGFAYERSCQYYKDFHIHDRVMFVFPRGAGSMEVHTASPKKTLAVDSQSVLIVPKGLRHDDEGTSAIYDTMALYPTQRQLLASARRLNVPLEKLEVFNCDCIKIKRTKKLAQLLQDYFFERVVSKTPADDTDAEYLGRKIIDEVLKSIFPDFASGSASHEDLPIGESVTVRALKYIESNLFEPLEVAEIAKRSGASVSTLIRKFRTEVGATPYSYIKNRRLEESLELLRSGEHSVGEVALLVGYENFGSFSEAFKLKYGRTPSSVQK